MTTDNLFMPPMPTRKCADLTKHLSGCLALALMFVYQAETSRSPEREFETAAFYIRQELTIDDFTHVKKELIYDELAQILRFTECALTAECVKHIVLANCSDLSGGGRHGHLNDALLNIADLMMIELRGIGRP